MDETIIKIDHVSKEYRLGAIGGGTLRGDLQSFMARIRGKEDPNAKIGQDVYAANQRFLALDDVSFSIKKGDRVGIIGHNGAGKSTLLKLLSRVTAPTKGSISYNGRIASMLEVGTGFHPELTGRENVYLNGAILGMNKAEIDKKINDIVRFAEMEKFIDTPVKRYSSGMYVKLAFSVAAHLDSEILLMDEVLAVGDMKFQQKCIERMLALVQNEGRTVLYVSHNMNTVRQLCNRCIVLKAGKVIFNGDVEDAVQIYLDNYLQTKPFVDFRDVARAEYLHNFTECRMTSCRVLNKDGIINDDEPMQFELEWDSSIAVKKLWLRIEFSCMGEALATSFLEAPIQNILPGTHRCNFEIDMQTFLPGTYETCLVLYGENPDGSSLDFDAVKGMIVEKVSKEKIFEHWNHKNWGKCVANHIYVSEEQIG